MYQKTVSSMRANASGSPVALPEIAADPRGHSGGNPLPRAD
jgi:hypothetical protein